MSDFNSSFYRILGERLRKKRVDLGLNQEDVANAVGLGRTSITNIETGRHQVPLSVLYRISFKLKTDIHAILPTYEEIEADMANDNNANQPLEGFDGIQFNKQFDEKIRLSIRNIYNNL